jgi:hypothetical protein
MTSYQTALCLICVHHIKTKREKCLNVRIHPLLQDKLLTAAYVRLRKKEKGRSRWPRRLSCGSAASRLLGLWVRIPPGHGCLFLVSVVCCQVEVSASGWSLVQRSPTECDREASIMSRPWPTRGCCTMKKKRMKRSLLTRTQPEMEAQTIAGWRGFSSSSVADG